MAFGKPDMIDQKGQFPVEHMDYRDLLPKRDSLNLVKLTHAVEGNGADAHVFPPLLRRLETHRHDPIRKRGRQIFFGDLIF